MSSMLRSAPSRPLRLHHVLLRQHKSPRAPTFRAIGSSTTTTTTNMAPSVEELHQKLDGFWAAIQPLRPDSPQEAYQKMSSFIAPNAKLYIKGMLAPPAVGPEGTIEEIRATTAYWSIVERRVLTRAASADGMTLVAEMKNALLIAGTPVDLDEIEVVRFDEAGLIADYRLHVDAEPIKTVFAKMQAGQ